MQLYIAEISQKNMYLASLFILGIWEYTSVQANLE
jgi:hypothetical protein